MNTSDSKPYYQLDPDTVLSQLGTTRDGLDPQLRPARIKQYGYNVLKQLHKESALHKYLKQFKDMMILLLMGCAVLAFATNDPHTGFVLIVLILFNTIIGFSQEFKAERLMESLERLVVAEAKVVVSGAVQEIVSDQLVPGDIIYIEEGDSVPADLRLIAETELASNDFALTGESNPSRKFVHAIDGSVELANRHNIVFMGTTVATGHGYGVVIGTGMQTELGRIAQLSSTTKSDVSPLQRELNHIAARVTQGTMLLCLVLLPLALYFGLPFKNALLFAIGVASSIIPQGLPAEINTALAQAANKLAHAKALVKKLSAVESLGATSIICTDKTGTLTKNQMTVESLLIGNKAYTVTGTGYEPIGAICHDEQPLSTNALEAFRMFFAAGVFASNATIDPPDNEHASWYVVGDPTEGALITLARKAGLDPAQLSGESPELKEFSFDSARKRMSSVRQFDGKRLLFVKGAPESVLERATHIELNGKRVALTPARKQSFIAQHQTWAHGAMRNLAFAYRTLPQTVALDSLDHTTAEQQLTILGMVSMLDPLRDEVPAAMRDAHAAHIHVSIITGDFATTAEAIAKKAGLAEGDVPLTVISGEELRALDDARIIQLVTSGSVIFSRVSPEDKLRIVGLVKDSGHVVAVTGDGINDAPALKRADIGVAMGKTGTDVAKQSAEIVLLDDSFKTLVGAVQQGRVIFQNIRKGTLSCFTSNSAELVVNMVSLAAFAIAGVPLAMSIMQILAIDMIAELFPIAALGWDKADKDVMNEKPRSPKNHILNRSSILDLLWCGLLIGGLAFLNYLLFFWRNGVGASGADASNPALYLQATTLTYLTIVLCQLSNILQRRSAKGLFTRYQLHNKQLWIAIAFSLFCVGNIIYNPVVIPFFGTQPLTFVDWLWAMSAASIFVLVREVQRYANNHHTPDHIIKAYAVR